MLKLLKTVPCTMINLCIFDDGSTGYASEQYNSLFGQRVPTPAHTLTPSQEAALEKAPSGLPRGDFVTHYTVYPGHPEFSAFELTLQNAKKAKTRTEFIKNSPKSLTKISLMVDCEIEIPDITSPYNVYCALKKALPHDFAVLRMQDRKAKGEFIRIVNTQTQERVEINATGLVV